MNIYKIDWNAYYDQRRPYGLFGKRKGWTEKWEQISSFETKEEARAEYEKLVGLPIALN